VLVCYWVDQDSKGGKSQRQDGAQRSTSSAAMVWGQSGDGPTQVQGLSRRFGGGG
jgi:hypothetical protein